MKQRDPHYPGAALAAGKKVTPDALQLLMQEHAQVMFYFEAYEAAGPLGRDRLERMICISLLAHMAMEEDILYPAALSLTAEAELVGDSYDDHDEAKELLTRLATGALDQVARLSLMQELKRAIEEHIDTEENELFPRLREEGLDGAAIGMAMARRRAEALSALTGKPIALGPNAVSHTEDVNVAG